MKLKKQIISVVWVSAVLSLGLVASAAPGGGAFTYQGQLKQTGVPVSVGAGEEYAEIAEPKARLARMERIVEQLVSEKERGKP